MYIGTYFVDSYVFNARSGRPVARRVVDLSFAGSVEYPYGRRLSSHVE